ncbi:MAG: ApbE family lipoprotein, partial [Firmicutes bacterium]|nr:ApbE family lipoprotein [Bacillota bacterium]
LGGIAKGYAADEVRRILLQHKVSNALINLGGNIAAMGLREDGMPWQIGIQNPLSARGEYIGTIEAADQTIVTSGSNEQFFIRDGVRYHHIIDPRTGCPADSGLLSVTAICRDSADADALTTAIFVSGISESVNMLKSADAQAIFVTESKDLFLTDGLRNKFKRSYS